MFSRLLNTNTAFFICDVQGCFLKSIFAVDEVIHSTSFLLKTARALEVPCVITEQYPDKLKHTGGEKNHVFMSSGLSFASDQRDGNPESIPRVSEG